MRLSVAIAAACLTTVGLSVAAESQASIRKQTNIAAQGLGPALQTLAKERDFQIIYAADDIGEKLTGGAVGDLTQEEALERLLKGTGLTYRHLDEKTITITLVESGDRKGAGARLAPASDRSNPEAGSRNDGLWERFRLARVAQETSAVAGTPAAPSGSLEEIVVTAQKREERLKDVPASISVLSGEAIQKIGATSLADYATLVPGLTVNSFGTPGQTQILLRGITTGGGASALVGTYIDETPFGSSTRQAGGGAFQLDLLPTDIERLEVLRGPQGTLYGASTMGGLLKYVLKTPDLNEFQGTVGGSMEETASSGDPNWSARGSLNMPIIPGALAMSLSGSYQSNAGYINNVGTGVDDENDNTAKYGRAALMWQATDELSIKGQAVVQRVDADGGAVVQVERASLAPVFGRYDRFTNVDEFYRQEVEYYSLTGDYDFGFANLTSASSWSHSKNLTGQDDFVDLPVQNGNQALFTDQNDFRKFTQEVRLTSDTSQAFEYLIGGFYTNERNSGVQIVQAFGPDGSPIGFDDALNPVPSGPLLYDLWFPSRYKEYAVFGDLTYKFGTRFDVTVGARQSHNESSYSQYASGLVNGGESVFFGDASDDVFTWMTSARYHIDPANMLYVRAASGYRPGGPNPANQGIPSQFDPDRLINYEFGYKGSLLDGRAALNAAVFYITWDKIQISVPNERGVYYPGNGKQASSRGVEFESTYRIVTGLSLGASFTYTDAKLDDDAPGIRGMADDRLPLTPRWTATTSLDYQRPLAARLDFQAGANYRYKGDSYSAPESSSSARRVPSQGIVDAHMGVRMGTTSVRLYARNLLNDYTFNRLYLSFYPGRSDYVLVQPRTVGISVDTTF